MLTPAPTSSSDLDTQVAAMITANDGLVELLRVRTTTMLAYASIYGSFYPIIYGATHTGIRAAISGRWRAAVRRQFCLRAGIALVQQVHDAVQSRVPSALSCPRADALVPCGFLMQVDTVH